MIKELVKPQDIDISNGLCGSELRSPEKEAIACNIIIISSHNNNEWLEFTFDEYKNRFTESERSILDKLVSDDLLTYSNGKYAIQDAFIAKLWEFVVKKR